MRTLIALLISVVSLVLAFSGCASTRDSEKEEDPAISAIELQARQERVRSYFKEKRKKRDVVATTVTESGQILDWIWPGNIRLQ